MTNDATPTISNKRGSRGLLILSECWPRGFPAIGPRLACNSLETTASECWIDPWETFGISEPVYQCPDSDCVVNASIPRNLSWGTHLAKWPADLVISNVLTCTVEVEIPDPVPNQRMCGDGGCAFSVTPNPKLRPWGTSYSTMTVARNDTARYEAHSVGVFVSPAPVVFSDCQRLQNLAPFVTPEGQSVALVSWKPPNPNNTCVGVHVTCSHSNYQNMSIGDHSVTYTVQTFMGITHCTFNIQVSTQLAAARAMVCQNLSAVTYVSTWARVSYPFHDNLLCYPPSVGTYEYQEIISVPPPPLFGMIRHRTLDTLAPTSRYMLELPGAELQSISLVARAATNSILQGLKELFMTLKSCFK